MKQANTGKGFEDAIEQQCRIYEAKGIAKIHRTAIPSRYVFKSTPHGKRKELIAVRGNNPWLDFFGVAFRRDGIIPIVLECKDINATSLAFNHEHGGLKRSEIKAIKDWCDFGAYCLVLWRRGKDVRMLNGTTITNLYEGGGKSVNWGCMRTINNYDFLDEGV